MVINFGDDNFAVGRNSVFVAQMLWDYQLAFLSNTHAVHSNSSAESNTNYPSTIQTRRNATPLRAHLASDRSAAPNRDVPKVESQATKAFLSSGSFVSRCEPRYSRSVTLGT